MIFDSGGKRCVFVCLFFLFCPNVYFYWARGANAREQPKEDRGKVRELTFPLSPLGFSLALPFPDSLTPLGRKSLVWLELNLSTATYWARIKQAAFIPSCGLYQLSGLRPQRGEGKERGERSTGVTVRGRTLGRGETRAQRGLPSLYGSSPRIRAPRPAESDTRTLDKNNKPQISFSKMDVGTADRPAPSGIKHSD